MGERGEGFISVSPIETKLSLNIIAKMIYDVRSPYFKRFLVRGGGSSSSSASKDVKAMLAQMLNNMNVVASAPVNATSA